MRIILLAVVAFCVIGAPLMAQGSSSVAAVQIWGDIVDNNSISTLKPDEVVSFMMNYKKEDAFKPANRFSGYSIYTNGKFIQFTSGSSSLITKFLSRPLNSNHVMVTAKWSGDQLEVLMIRNQ